MPLIKCIQGSPEWHEARKGKLTASIAAACLGLDPNCSRQKAWRIIRGTEIEKPNEYRDKLLAHGNTFEAAARTAYELETGNLVLETGFWVHPSIPWLGASPDGLVGREGGVEIKCPGTLPTEIPERHRIQMEVCMWCTGRAWWDYLAWTHTGHYLSHCVMGMGTMPDLIWKLEHFYKTYVLTGTEPPRKERKKKPKVVESEL